MADETQTINEDDVQDVSLINPVEESTDDNVTSDTDEQAKDEGTDADNKSEDDTKTEADDTTADSKEDQPQKTEAEIRQEQKARAQMEYQKRQQARQQVAQAIDEQYGPKTQEQLQEEGMDAQAAQIEALRQEMQYTQRRTEIAELNAGMQAEAVNVVNDFDVFNPKSPNYDEQFTQMVEQQYRVASRLQVDDQGIILNAEVPLYDYYERMANIYGHSASKQAEKAQKDAMSVLSRTENIGGSSSSRSAGNSLEELEERLGDASIL